MSPVSYYDEKLQSSAFSTFGSKRKLYTERLNISTEKKSELATSTLGSVAYHSDGLVNSPRGEYQFPVQSKLDSQEKLQKKLAGVTKTRHKMGFVDLFDKKYNSKLKQLLFYFEKLYPKVSSRDDEINAANILIEIENTAYSIINYIVFQNHNLKGKNQEFENKMKQNVLTMSRLESQAKNNFELELQELKKLKEQLEKDSSDKEFAKNLHSVEVHKLESQNEYLQSELNRFLGMFNADFLNSIDNLKATSEKKIENCLKIINEKEILATRFEIMYAGAKKMNENFDKKIKELEFQLFESLDKQKYYKELSEELQGRNNHYYEKLNMRTADYEGLLEQNLEMKEQLSVLRERFIMERKNQQKEKDQKSQQNAQIEDAFLKEIEAAEELKKMFSSYMGPGKQVYLDRVKNKESKENKETIENEKPFPELDMRNYMLAKPTYEQLFVGIKQQGNQNNFKLNVDMLATIRAILDSKFNEFVYFNDYKNVTSFPDFVYSWFGKYVFDLEQRKIRGVDMTDPDPDVARVEIIHLLQAPISKKLWDCIIFKEFLDEAHTKDELIYYLHCRNLLFQGPQLADPSSTFTFVYYVRYDWVERVIDHLLTAKYDKITIKAIKQKLQERIKKKNNYELIDSGLLLRILLEEYKNHKKGRFAQIKTALTQELHLKFEATKLSFGFSSFKNFMNFYFPEAYELEKAELFRKCWVINHGIVDIDSILTVLNEENYFAKDIKFQMFEGLVPISKQLELHLNENNNEVYNFIKQTCTQMVVNLDPLKAASWEFGVENVTMEIYKYEARLLNSSWVQNGRLVEKEFYLWLLSFLSYTSRLNKVSTHLYFEENLKLTQEWMQKIFPRIQIGLMEGPSAQVSQLREFEVNRKVKVLQKFMKTKLSGWYKLMSFVLKAKLQSKLANKKHVF